ncbi:TetR/AcrR family transcriptional regulator [Nocardia asteroides]|uniref:TetR/AcrR family transcriptional regulator n=1 Tax=Nocardia asteroides TaxID=1824 RepID=UPI001E5901E1|nr:TetR/AcrR family transcriptional regulator [Nocardia asteroides]UGT62208.1 TetR/AcrR family transcriptional regulator [Nocardia asteroides]
MTDTAETDPRRLRSRARLLDAATSLLRSGGLDAVTVDAVTKVSKVARTTLYRHFSSAAQLRAATLERLLPPPVHAPADGTLRDRLVELLTRQAKVIEEAPLHLATVAWLATDPGDGPATSALRARLIEQYRVPFDELLDGREARAVLGEHDRVQVLIQLVGPLVFTRLVGLGDASPAACARLVDDFLAARAALSRARAK